MLLDKKKNKRRLIGCNGYYSIINTVAILRQIGDADSTENILVIQVEGMNGDSLISFAKSFSEFNSIHISFLKSAQCFFDVRNNIGNNFFDEIMVPFTFMIGNYVKTNTIIFSDEGVGTYTNLNDNIINYYEYNYKTYLLDVSFLHGCDNIKNIEINQINKSIYYSVLRDTENNLTLKNNSVIFLGSLYKSKDNGDFYDKEDTLIIKELIDKGYNVYFKLHPRNSLKSVSNIVKSINSNKLFIVDNSTHPLIESVLFYNKDKIKFIVGKSSSILYFSYNLFNIPSFTILIKEHYDSRNLIYLFPLKYLPDIKDFLNSQLDPITFYNNTKECLNSALDRFAIANNRLLLLEKKLQENKIDKRKFRKKSIVVILFILFLLILHYSISI